MSDLTRAFAEFQRLCFEECEWAEWDPTKSNTFPDEITHLHSELSEAFEAWRLTKNASVIWYGDDGKPEGIPIEFADVLIGLFYNAELHGFDLFEAFKIKHEWNLRRNYQAEGRALHPSD